MWLSLSSNDKLSSFWPETNAWQPEMYRRFNCITVSESSLYMRSRGFYSCYSFIYLRVIDGALAFICPALSIGDAYASGTASLWWIFHRYVFAFSRSRFNFQRFPFLCLVRKSHTSNFKWLFTSPRLLSLVRCTFSALPFGWYMRHIVTCFRFLSQTFFISVKGERIIFSVCT